MSGKNLKKLPIGNEDFTYIIQNGGYYVDKTSYLKKVFSNISPVILFTRPRRFGKTLLMDMFKSFLRVAPDGSANREYKEKLFAGLEILKDKEFTDKYMGQFPVISISLKEVYGETYQQAYDKLVEIVSELGDKFSFLLESKVISPEQKQVLLKLKNQLELLDPKYQSLVTGALKTYSNCLYKHYSKKVIILIDEYDVPLAKASENGYQGTDKALAGVVVGCVVERFEGSKLSDEFFICLFLKFRPELRVRLYFRERVSAGCSFYVQTAASA